MKRDELNHTGAHKINNVLGQIILAKRMGHRPDGWEVAAGPFADDAPRSVADIDGPEALATVRAWKKAQKAAGKTKQQ